MGPPVRGEGGWAAGAGHRGGGPRTSLERGLLLQGQAELAGALRELLLDALGVLRARQEGARLLAPEDPKEPLPLLGQLPQERAAQERHHHVAAVAGGGDVQDGALHSVPVDPVHHLLQDGGPPVIVAVVQSTLDHVAGRAVGGQHGHRERALQQLLKDGPAILGLVLQGVLDDEVPVLVAGERLRVVHYLVEQLADLVRFVVLQQAFEHAAAAAVPGDFGGTPARDEPPDRLVLVGVQRLDELRQDVVALVAQGNAAGSFFVAFVLCLFERRTRQRRERERERTRGNTEAGGEKAPSKFRLGTR